MSVYIKINAKVVLVGNNCCTRKLSCIINTAMITFCVVWIYVTRNIVFCIKGGITNHQLVLDSVRSNFISIPLTICTDSLSQFSLNEISCSALVKNVIFLVFSFTNIFSVN